MRGSVGSNPTFSSKIMEDWQSGDCSGLLNRRPVKAGPRVRVPYLPPMGLVTQRRVSLTEVRGLLRVRVPSNPSSLLLQLKRKLPFDKEVAVS